MGRKQRQNIDFSNSDQLSLIYNHHQITGGWLPDLFKNTGRVINHRFEDRQGMTLRIAATFKARGKTPLFYSLPLYLLGLAHLEDAHNILQEDAVQAIKTAVWSRFDGPVYLWLEVGHESEKLHVHVISDDENPCLEEAPNPQQQKPVWCMPGLMRYSCKAAMPPLPDLVARVLYGRITHQQLPSRTFSRGIMQVATLKRDHPKALNYAQTELACYSLRYRKQQKDRLKRQKRLAVVLLAPRRMSPARLAPIRGHQLQPDPLPPTPWPCSLPWVGKTAGP